MTKVCPRCKRPLPEAHFHGREICALCHYEIKCQGKEGSQMFTAQLPYWDYQAVALERYAEYRCPDLMTSHLRLPVALDTPWAMPWWGREHE